MRRTSGQAARWLRLDPRGQDGHNWDGRTPQGRPAREQGPGVIEIVDLFHAKERLWDVAKALHAGDAVHVEAWAKARCDELAHGNFHDMH